MLKPAENIFGPGPLLQSPPLAGLAPSTGTTAKPLSGRPPPPPSHPMSIGQIDRRPNRACRVPPNPGHSGAADTSPHGLLLSKSDWAIRPLRCECAVGCGCSSGVEHNLAKVGVEGSNPFARSKFI